jgi:CheY-like chemotaxis protein
VNARDAMPRGGRLTIQTSNAHIGKDNALARGLEAAGDFGLAKVCDTGVGMTEEVGARIFEPFFTTKAVGHGTGLGLASAYGIVKQSRGHIWVESRIGEGTTFTIAFPRASEDVIEALRAPDPTASPRGRETILLAEDDAAIRTLAARTLRALGYRVLDAADGVAALELARAQEGPVHLLITDVVMPRGGGADLARQVRAEWPGVALLFVSGYPEAPSFDPDPAAGTVAFLHKPYSQADLASKVRETLDGAAGMVGITDAP